MAGRMYLFKASPGYSKHTKGLAIDFTTSQGRVTYGPNGSQKNGWKTTWLYKWLVKHAADHGFEPYAAEPWHWQHTPPAEAETPAEAEAPAEAPAEAETPAEAPAGSAT
jgi:LAS superfamily LD-carboxypeptidase LdcB